MSSHAAFLSEIREAPDDDVPRMIYADWLEDNGDAERADFIRAELERDNGEDPDVKHDIPHPDADSEWQPVSERLWAAYGEEWFGTISPLVREWYTRRGFVHSVVCDARQFVRNAAAIFRAAPLVRWLHLDRLGANLPALAALPEMSRLTRLEFGKARLGTSGLETLLRSPHLPNLRGFEAIDCRIGLAGVIALLRAPKLASLAELDLENNPIGYHGAEAVLAATQLTGLRSLDLGNTGLPDIAALLVAAEHLGGLRHLTLTNNYLEEGSCAALARCRHFAGLRSLLLGGNALGDVGVLALAESPHLRLERLRLWRVGAGDASVTALLRSAVVSGVRELSVGGNTLGRESLQSLGALRELRWLVLGGCDLGDAAAKRLADADLDHVRQFDLWGNRFGKRGRRILKQRFGDRADFGDEEEAT